MAIMGITEITGITMKTAGKYINKNRDKNKYKILARVRRENEFLWN